MQGNSQAISDLSSVTLSACPAPSWSRSLEVLAPWSNRIGCRRGAAAVPPASLSGQRRKGIMPCIWDTGSACQAPRAGQKVTASPTHPAWLCGSRGVVGAPRRWLAR